MPIQKGQRHRVGCGCFAPAWDLHPRCAFHWEIGDCVFYSTDFSLLSVRCEFCESWTSEHWLALASAKSYSKRQSVRARKLKADISHDIIIMSSPTKVPKVVPSTPTTASKKQKSSRKPSAKPVAPATVSASVDELFADPDLIVTKHATPVVNRTGVKPSSSVTTLPVNPIPTPSCVEKATPSPLLSEALLLQMMEFMRSNSIVQPVAPVLLTSLKTGSQQQQESNIRVPATPAVRDWRDEPIYQSREPFYKDRYWDVSSPPAVGRRSPLRNRLPINLQVSSAAVRASTDSVPTGTEVRPARSTDLEVLPSSAEQKNKDRRSSTAGNRRSLDRRSLDRRSPDRRYPGRRSLDRRSSDRRSPETADHRSSRTADRRSGDAARLQPSGASGGRAQDHLRLRDLRYAADQQGG